MVPHADVCLQVKLDRGLDFSGLDDVLVDMKLAPQVLELPCPAYFREERSKVYIASSCCQDTVCCCQRQKVQCFQIVVPL